MLERLAGVQRKYPTIKMSIYRLRKMYYKNKIKKKVIRFRKKRDIAKSAQHEQLVRELSREVRFAKEQRFRVVQLDEMVVTKSTIPKGDWAEPLANSELDISKINTKPIAVLGAVSMEYGVELVMMFKKSVNIKRFKVFLD